MRKIFLFFLWGVTCMAHAPSFDFIIAEMAKSCISGKTQFTGVMTEKDEISFVTLTLDGGNLAMLNKKSVKAPNDQIRTKKEQINLYLLQDLLVCEKSTAKKLKDYISARGIDTTKISHGLFGFEPVFIIGAQQNDLTAPRIVVAKQNFLPLMEKTKDYETVFEHWTSVSSLSDKKWPSTIHAKHNNSEVKLDMAEVIEPRPKRN